MRRQLDCMLYFLLCSSVGYTITSSWLDLFSTAVDPPYCLQLSRSSAPMLSLFDKKDLKQEHRPWICCQWNKDADVINIELRAVWREELCPTLPAANRWHPLTASKTFGEISGWAGRWDWARDCFTFFTSTRHRALSSPGNKNGYISSRENSLFSTKVCSVT